MPPQKVEIKATMTATIELTTEQRILEAAKKVFLLRGLDGARMQEIADEAGINKAMLHTRAVETPQ